MIQIIYIILFLFLPAGLLWLIEKQAWAKKLGAIILCYSMGLVLGNIGLMPESVAVAQSSLSELSVALALPMLLLTLNIKEWSAMAGKAMLSLIFATASVVTVASTFFFIYADENVIQRSHLAAMSIGVYTGGTPNLAAIKSGLDIPDDLYILFHSFDTLLGAIYLLFMLSIAVPMFRRWLPSNYKDNSDGRAVDSFSSDRELASYDENYAPLLKTENWPQITKIICLSFVVLGMSMMFTKFTKELIGVQLGVQSSGAVTILFLTSFGIVLSLSSRLREFHLAYKLGMYLILVFCLVVASMADIKKLTELDATIALFLFGTVFASVLLHSLLCKLAKVDSDTFMVTSVSAICSPPFVPMMAKALNNPTLLLSGMTTGIIGFAIGNYLGISLALLLQSMS